MPSDHPRSRRSSDQIACTSSAMETSQLYRWETAQLPNRTWPPVAYTMGPPKVPQVQLKSPRICVEGAPHLGIFGGLPSPRPSICLLDFPPKDFAGRGLKTNLVFSVPEDLHIRILLKNENMDLENPRGNQQQLWAIGDSS